LWAHAAPAPRIRPRGVVAGRSAGRSFATTAIMCAPATRSLLPAQKSAPFGAAAECWIDREPAVWTKPRDHEESAAPCAEPNFPIHEDPALSPAVTCVDETSPSIEEQQRRPHDPVRRLCGVGAVKPLGYWGLTWSTCNRRARCRQTSHALTVYEAPMSRPLLVRWWRAATDRRQGMPLRGSLCSARSGHS
jgi:hypothetical protein